MKLKETADFQRVMNTQKNRKVKEKRKKRKREWKENNPKPQNAKESDVYNEYLDIINELSEKSGRTLEEARFCFFSCIELGAYTNEAYTEALHTLLIMNALGV